MLQYCYITNINFQLDIIKKEAVIMVKNAVQLVKDAVKNDEFCELLEGKGEYYWESLFVTIPTDWNIIIHRGIYGAYKENPDEMGRHAAGQGYPHENN